MVRIPVLEKAKFNSDAFKIECMYMNRHDVLWERRKKSNQIIFSENAPPLRHKGW